jgi:hypothetical protein
MFDRTRRGSSTARSTATGTGSSPLFKKSGLVAIGCDIALPQDANIVFRASLFGQRVCHSCVRGAVLTRKRGSESEPILTFDQAASCRHSALQFESSHRPLRECAPSPLSRVASQAVAQKSGLFAVGNAASFRGK